MKAAPGKQKRWLVLAGLFCIIWLVAPVAVKSIVYRGVNVFHAPIQTGFAKIGEIQDYWALRLNAKNDLIEENRALARENALLQTQLNRAQTALNYTNRLERLLMLEPIEGYDMVYARVIRREVSVWFEYLEIDVGRQQGIQAGDAVIFIEGVVGRVSDVQLGISRVLLISSPQFRITLNTINDARPITYLGAGQRAFVALAGELRHIPQDVQILNDKAIPTYTSGLGGAFPPGIYAGEIIQLEPDVEGLFQGGKLKLNDELRYVREVAVLIPSARAS